MYYVHTQHRNKKYCIVYCIDTNDVHNVEGKEVKNVEHGQCFNFRICFVLTISNDLMLCLHLT